MPSEYTFTPVGGRPLVFAAVPVTCRELIEPCVDADTVTSILDAWKAVDPDARTFLWPTTLRDDDDCSVAYTIDGKVFLETWTTADGHGMYSFDSLPFLLPEDHFALTS